MNSRLLLAGITVITIVCFWISSFSKWGSIILLNALLGFTVALWYFTPQNKHIKSRDNKIERREIRNLIDAMSLGNVDVYLLNSDIPSAFQVGAHGKYIMVTKSAYKILNDDEFLAVVAHELAHIKLKHVAKKMVCL